MLPNFRIPPETGKEPLAARDERSEGKGKFVTDAEQAEWSKPPERMDPNTVTVEPETSVQGQEKACTTECPDEWRQEVAARLSRYRQRRQPRAPRYPSLTLKFETPEPRECEDHLVNEPEAFQVIPEKQESPFRPLPNYEAPPEPRLLVNETAKLIEFPRTWVPQPRPSDELAEPMMDRPRILEVPEVLPPPPALGGMLIEDVQEENRERLPGFDIPLQAAALSHRLLAGSVDALVVICAFATFGCVVFKIAPIVVPWQQLLAVSVLLLWLFWAGYEYLMTVYTGSTPGLRFAKLRLSRFDGTPAARKVRKWRALASVLSAASVGLGYAWCFLDEDGLCWHDRITKTYIAPHPEKNSRGRSA